MKTFLIIMVLAILTSCSPRTIATVQTTPTNGNVDIAPVPTILMSDADMTDNGLKSSLPDLGAAPELKTNVWLNSETPLRLSALKGNVVLLEMWTYGCINCRNVIPGLKDWHAKYSKQGLVIIGNHFPEFDQERDLKNLTDAIARLGIEYPVTQDNNGDTWRAYNNQFWPTLYLIDKNGHIRYTHIGEGSYKETELAIQTLLLEK